MPTNICEEPTNTVQFTDPYLSSEDCAAPPTTTARFPAFYVNASYTTASSTCEPPRRSRRRDDRPTYYVPGRAEDLIYRYRRNRVLQHADAQDNQCIRGELRKAAEAYEYRRPDWWPSRFGTLDLRDDKHNLAWAGAFLRAEVNRLERESWDSEDNHPGTEAALEDADWDLKRVTRKLGDILGLEDTPLVSGTPEPPGEDLALAQMAIDGAPTSPVEDPF